MVPWIKFYLQVAALLLDAPLDFEVQPIEEEVASLNGILSDLGCADSFDSPVSVEFRFFGWEELHILNGYVGCRIPPGS